MSISNTFPVFEPDQVLTNKHLNDLFNYLDQQDRLTRCKLLGSGIVCGLEISNTGNTINVTKGCGLTTQGYIILFCDHTGEEGYKYYVPYTRPAFPNDLQLITQCGLDPNRNNILFYASDAAGTAPNNTVLLLLTQKEFDALTDKTGAIPLSQGADLSQYAVVLFLDVSELSLKNCDTNDCNDKGSRMELDVVPLLVQKRLLNGNNNNGGGNLTFQHIELRRYNVPVKNLTSSDAVLNAFVTLLDDSTLQSLAVDLEKTFTDYQYLLPGITTNPFGPLADFKNNLLFIIKFQPILIQYYYDFIYDLIKALYEFRHKAHALTSDCCGDEMRFPFHLTLGEATVNTNTSTQSAYRQYFVYSPLFDAQNDGSNELRSLLMRMILMYQEFLFTEKSLVENKMTLPQEVKITPSNYGHDFLSDRCIPYYYGVVQEKNSVIPGDLYYYWNYDKTKRGNARFNLSYNAADYNNADTVIHPLFYDIEWYNFFRMEGHIGSNITTALGNVKSIQQNFNLPFDVVALSADYIGALVKGEEPECSIQDLESDYRMLIVEFVCKIHDIFCYVGKLPFTPATQVLSTSLFTEGAKTGAATVLSPITNSVNILIDHPFISGLVNEFQATAAYTKGDTLTRLCSPVANTTGNFYVNSISANNGKFVNPIPANATTANDILYRHFFEFIDSIESMFQGLMTESLSVLNTVNFKAVYNRYETEVNFINVAMLEFIKTLEADGKTPDLTIDYLLDLFVDNVQMILHTCIIERLEALKNEYLRRIAQYRMAKNFSYYFRKHGGIEHKAGVPRGGTFILVYHEERRNRLVDVNSLFINRELSSLLLSSFRELLRDDTPLDTLEAKAKMLAVATLYKDPALYLRFKDVMQQYLDDCKDLPPDKRTQISTIIDQVPELTGFVLPDGIVIADFYVPYMCCSDCPPVAYILPERPTDTIVFDIQPRTFLFDDAHNYPFTTVPPVTQANAEQNPFSSPDLTNPGMLNLWADENNILYLHPAMAINKTLKTTVAYKNNSLDLTIIKPDATFTVTVTNTNDTLQLQVKAVNEDATEYEWIVNGNNTILPENSPKPRLIVIGPNDTTPAYTIELIITYNVNKAVSDDSLKRSFTKDVLRGHADNKPF
ncbi:MAG TPA: hypothetical protein VNS58_13825 [Puia sp.]|nr:hypothetical protein [Puia sp.]